MAAPTGKGRRKPAQLICDRCGAINKATASECSSCGSKRFAREWVQQLRRVNRSFAVQVTDAHPLSESTDPVLTLYKWWPGGKASFNIPNAAQWEAVRRIVETELAPFLGWRTPEEAAKASKQAAKVDKQAQAELAARTGQDPKALARIIRSLKLADVAPEELPQLGEAIADIAEVLVGMDEGRRKAIQKIIAKLPEQGEKALEQLADLMEELTIGQIAAVASEVKRRVGLLNLFKERVLDDRTYEIRGDGSIHRLLEQAMWIVDEHYWLMFSNSQLRTIVTEQLLKEDKTHELERPDFVCGTVDKRLILIEIKRPSHTLTVNDYQQLVRYVVLCEEYHTDHSGFDAILVGQKKSDELDRTLKVLGNRIKVKTYTDLIGDTERRYKRYLDALAAQTPT
jgi:DNA-directed RNA polymerase subunit RPC12/RpoP